jgi:hypothetical protein
VCLVFLLEGDYEDSFDRLNRSDRKISKREGQEESLLLPLMHMRIYVME